MRSYCSGIGGVEVIVSSKVQIILEPPSKIATDQEFCISGAAANRLQRKHLSCTEAASAGI